MYRDSEKIRRGLCGRNCSEMTPLLQNVYMRSSSCPSTAEFLAIQILPKYVKQLSCCTAVKSFLALEGDYYAITVAR